MESMASGKGSGLARRLAFSELFAIFAGAPAAAAFGGFMIGSGRVATKDFVLVVLEVMAPCLLLLVLPPFAWLMARVRKGIFAFRSSSSPGGDGQGKAAGLDEAGSLALFRFVSRLPLIEAGLVFGRIVLSTLVVLIALSAAFESLLPALVAFCFATYAGFVSAVFIYYFLHGPASRFAEAIVAASPAEGAIKTQVRESKMGLVVDSLPLMVPTFLSSAGVILLLVGAAGGAASGVAGGADAAFSSGRVAAALLINFLVIGPILVYGRLFHRKRLKEIRRALGDMVERGNAGSRLPTDLGDEYALTAHDINRAFDLFRLVQSRLQSATEGLSGMMASFSAQVGQTVSSTTLQAEAVKEMVGTMEDTNAISAHILERAQDLSGNASESNSFVDQGFGKVQEAKGKMEEIRDANLRTLGEISELSEEISSIGEIIEIINNIANQTRIIAFNAELEASSAGSAGTSFRIVAEEIRRLANGTVDALIGIKGRVGQIQQASQELLVSSEEGTAKIEEGMLLSGDLYGIFSEIRDSAEATSGAAEGIRSMLREQNTAFDQIFTTLKQISEGSEQVLASSRISGAEVQRLRALIDGLKGLLTRFGGEGQGMEASRKDE